MLDFLRVSKKLTKNSAKVQSTPKKAQKNVYFVVNTYYFCHHTFSVAMTQAKIKAFKMSIGLYQSRHNFVFKAGSKREKLSQKTGFTKSLSFGGMVLQRKKSKCFGFKCFGFGF